MEIVVAVGAPALAFAGAYLGNRRAVRADRQVDAWRRREETMRMVRWAADKAYVTSPHEARFGLEALVALLDAEILQPEDEGCVAHLAEIATPGVSGLPWDHENREEDPS